MKHFIQDHLDSLTMGLLILLALTVHLYGCQADYDEHGPIVQIGGGGFKCSGVVIAEDIILTAAHCKQNDGPHSVRDRDGLYLGRSESFVVHPEYNGVYHDIAVLRTVKPLDVDEFGVLPDGENFSYPELVGGFLTFAGFGIGHAPLAEGHAEVVGVTGYGDLVVSEHGITSCKGDSGAGGFLGDVVVGVVARGKQIEKNNKITCLGDSVYTDVFFHLEWVKEAIK